MRNSEKILTFVLCNSYSENEADVGGNLRGIEGGKSVQELLERVPSAEVYKASGRAGPIRPVLDSILGICPYMVIIDCSHQLALCGEVCSILGIVSIYGNN